MLAACRGKLRITVLIFFGILIVGGLDVIGQQDSISAFTLSECIDYALDNQPLIRQSVIDEAINRHNINIALSGWWPQITTKGTAQHYLKRPVSSFPNITDPTGPRLLVTTSTVNSSAIQFSGNQNIYTTELLFAGITARNLKKRASENTQNVKINVLVDVSKAFYDILLSGQQINVLDEDIQRLKRNLSDAYSLYQTGVNDKTDYERASISLKNTEAERRGAMEALKVKYAVIKQLMGYPEAKSLQISYDSAAMEKDIFVDTLQNLNYSKRIEFQILQTNLNLQKTQVGYYKWSFLPSLSAFEEYNVMYFNDKASALYDKAFPNSLAGLTLSLPLFQGFSRLQNIKIANLQYNRMELALENLKYQINVEYTQALASYKSNLTQLFVNRDNVKTAREIYDIVKLQYNQGIINYLEVIVAETDLRTAQLNYLVALYQVLSSALDVKRALGNIVVE